MALKQKLEKIMLVRRYLSHGLLLIFGITIGLMIQSGWIALRREATNQSIEKTVVVQLKQRVRNGMTLSELTEIVGAGAFDLPSQPPSVLLEVLRARNDGYFDTDTFVALRVGRGTNWFQIRDGRIVNLIPEIDFGTSEEITPLAKCHNKAMDTKGSISLVRLASS
jgi:hypothetical protein